MGSIGPLQLVLVLVVALLVFGGRGRISSIMSDMAKGIRSFRSGLNDADDDDADANKPQTSERKALKNSDVVDVTPETEKSKSSS